MGGYMHMNEDSLELESKVVVGANKSTGNRTWFFEGFVCS